MFASFALLRIFFTSNLAAFVGGGSKRFCPQTQGTLATPQITLWVSVLRHNGFIAVPADWIDCLSPLSRGGKCDRLHWNCLTKETQHIIFYAHVHDCCPSYTDHKVTTDQDWKTLWSISKQYVICLVDQSFDRAMKTVLSIL